MARRINFFDGHDSSTTPVITNIETSQLVRYANNAAFEAAEAGAPQNGNIYYNTTTNTVRFYDGGSSSWVEILDESSNQTATGKTMSGNNNTITDIDGDNVDIDANGNLAAGTAQSSLEAHQTTLDDHETRITTAETDISGKQSTSEKGQANGYASLDGTGKVPASELPSYVDDVEEYANLAAFPGTGESGKIYVALDTLRTYRWTGSVYAEISPSDVLSVNGQTGTAVLDADDIDDTATTNKFANNADLKDLNDVTITSPVTGQGIKWDGAKWINDTVGSGNGGSGINYITNNDFEVDTTGWAAYADAAATSPVDGTGGSPNATIALTSAGAELIRGTNSLKFAKDAVDRQGEGFSNDFTIDPADKSRMLNVSFAYKTSANYANGDIKVFVYDVDNTTLIGSVFNTEDGDILKFTGDGGRFLGQFQATDSLNYRLIFHVTSTNASAYDLITDQVKVGPDSSIPGYISEYLGEKTTTGSWTTNATYTGKYWRDGDHLIGKVSVDLAGAPNAASLTINLPDGLTIDTNKLSTTSGRQNLGMANINDNSADGYPAVVLYSSTTAVLVASLEESGTTDTRHNGVNATQPVTFANNDGVHIHYRVPISGWENTALISSTERLFKKALTRVESNSTLSVGTGATTLIYEDVLQDDLSLYNNTTGEFTCHKAGRLKVHCLINTASVAYSASDRLIAEVYKNGSAERALFVKRVSSAITNTITDDGEAIIDVVKGDVITIRALSSVATTLDGSSRFNHATFEYLEDLHTFSSFNETAFARVYESQTSGTEGGSSSAGFQFRTLNTLEITGPSGWISLASDTITLSPGMYKIRAKAPANRGSGHRIFFYDNDAASRVLKGNNGFGNTSNGNNTFSFIDDVIIVSEETDFKLQHHIESAFATTGLGLADGSTEDEIYSDIFIEKVK